MAVRWLLVPVVTVLALAVSPAQAQAQVGHVHMLVILDPPIINDANELVYELRVLNLGPDTATGVQTMRNVLLCPAASTPLAECVNTPPDVRQMADIPPGGEDVYRTRIPVREVYPETVRTTVQVVRINEQDDFSVPGTCDYGQVPQDACDTDVLSLLP